VRLEPRAGRAGGVLGWLAVVPIAPADAEAINREPSFDVEES
jgi:hypothetical protein